MDIRPRFSLVAALVIAIALAACGDDDNPATPNDTTPPSVSSVTPVDDHHIDIAFSETVTKASAEDEDNYTITPAPLPVARKGGAAAAGGITVAGATLKGDNKTVSLSTDQSMAGLNLQVTVHDVSDATGNKIGEGGSGKTFTGSNTTDATAPSVVSHAPVTDATNIAVNATVVVNYSEAIATASAQWFAGPGAGASANAVGGVSFFQQIDGSKLTLTLQGGSLAYSQLYTVTVNADDFAGNHSGTTQWSFTTTANNDHTPPTLVSTVPNNLAANVDVNSDLSLTFSEAINQSEFNVEIVPDAGDGTATWSEDGKTVTFNPAAPLTDNTQYTFTIFPNGVFDLAGNGIVGVHTVQFTTAATLAGGSIAGTVTGDAGTPAANPTGANVIAVDSSPFNGETFHVFGSTTVPASHNYSVLYLVDATYYIVSVKDTNGDGDLDPSTGDAIGGYGVDVPGGDLDPDSIAVTGGAHVTGKSFTLYDPSTASGTVQYTGTAKGDYPIFVGLFDTTGFTTTSDPVAGIEAFGFDHEWEFNSAEGAVPEDDYYVGAFMDVNNSGLYEPLVDPAGFYGGLPAPTAVAVKNGTDTAGIVVHITDPTPGMTAATGSVLWPKAKHNAAFQRLVNIVRQSQQQASR